MLKTYIIALAIMLMACGRVFAHIQGDTLINIPQMTICDFDFDPITGYTAPEYTILSITSSDESVVRFINGKFHPVAIGKAVINITYAYPLGNISALAHLSKEMIITDIFVPTVAIDTNFTRSCDGPMITYVANSDAPPGSIYQWQVNGVNSGDNSLTFTSSTLQDGDVLSFTAIMDNKCRTPGSTSIIVNTASSVKIKQQGVLPCLGSPVSIAATTAHINTIVSWQWYVNGVNSGISDSTFTSSNFNNGDVVDCQITYKNDATCTITHTVLSAPINVSFKPIISPGVTIAASENPACSGTPITFTATISNNGTGTVYQWQVNGTDRGTGTTFTSSAFKNNDVVSCMVSTSECVVPVSSLPAVVKLFDVPTVVLPAKVSVILGNGKQLQATVTGNIATYKWTPAAGLSSDNTANPVVTPGNTTTYKLTVTSTDGCEAEASVTINLIVPIIVPNAFTPNGDGTNDSWHIPALAYYPHCLVNIYSRNGSLVFHSNGYTVNWDGNYNGKLLPTGTYYFIIEAESKGAKVSGPVTIIR